MYIHVHSSRLQIIIIISSVHYSTMSLRRWAHPGKVYKAAYLGGTLYVLQATYRARMDFHAILAFYTPV